jgi:multidrug efflux pump subunit AcrA (membrane-fusion protein)
MSPKFCCLIALLLVAGSWTYGQQPPVGGSASTVTLPDCVVTLIDEAEVGPHEAGVLTAVEAFEGLEVEEGTLLALIDDSLVQSERSLAEAEWKVAQAEAENDSEEKVARATLEVANAELAQVEEANRKAQGAKSQAEINVKRLTVFKSKEQVIFARRNHAIAAIKASAAQEKVKAADIAIERRRVVSPLTGKVVKVYRHKGEYATPTEPVMRVVRLDRLRVVGFVDYQQFTPGDLHARPVTLNVQLAGSRPATFEGKITFVNPIVHATTSKFEIHAEVVNRQENGEWILQPGLAGTLTVDLTHRVEQREAGKDGAAGPTLTR